jgi:hypothetical protein
MYSVIVVLLLILPALSAILEPAFSPIGVSIMGPVGKWYVFGACGIRLLLAVVVHCWL